MARIEATLGKDESVAFRTRLHWAIYLRPALWTLVLVGLPFLLAAAIRDATSEYLITNRRLLIRSGLIFRSTVQLSLDKLAAVEVQQGRLGRLFNYGTVVIVTRDARRPFSGLVDPLRFRQAANRTRFGAISS